MILSFRWIDSDTHNVDWEWGEFATSSNQNTLGYNETFTINVTHAGQTLHAFCGIHPTIQATIYVAPSNLTHFRNDYTSGDSRKLRCVSYHFNTQDEGRAGTAVKSWGPSNDRLYSNSLDWGGERNYCTADGQVTGECRASFGTGNTRFAYSFSDTASTDQVVNFGTALTSHEECADRCYAHEECLGFAIWDQASGTSPSMPAGTCAMFRQCSSAELVNENWLERQSSYVKIRWPDFTPKTVHTSKMCIASTETGILDWTLTDFPPTVPECEAWCKQNHPSTEIIRIDNWGRCTCFTMEGCSTIEERVTYAGTGSPTIPQGNGAAMLYELDTPSPTVSPTVSPTAHPSVSPTSHPSMSPTVSPTGHPSVSPTVSPTGHPSVSPTVSPTGHPSVSPTGHPSMSPTVSPTDHPSVSPTDHPSVSPTVSPTDHPSVSPTGHPSASPTGHPTKSPTYTGQTYSPTDHPSMSPTDHPSVSPTVSPTDHPSVSPTVSPTDHPSASPTDHPSVSPTDHPSVSPPTNAPSTNPTVSPTIPTSTPSKSTLDKILDNLGITETDFIIGAISVVLLLLLVIRGIVPKIFSSGSVESAYIPIQF